MIVEASITINGPKAAVWAAITDIEKAASIIRGVESIEILEKPAGLNGLKWRETRILFGKPASVEKRIVEAVDAEYYVAAAESDGFAFRTTKKVSEGAGGTTLTEIHDSRPLGFAARLMSVPMGIFFKGMARKAVMQDLIDIKAAIERK